MHQLFPDWIRVLTPNGDLSNMSWEAWGGGVDGFLENANADDVINLARCAHGMATGEWDDEWREHLRESDPAFPLREQDQMVAVLAGAALITAREESQSPVATLALYAAVCATHAGWTPVLPDVRVDAATLRSLAEDERQTPPWRAAKVQVTSTSYEPSLPSADSAATGAHLTAVAHGVAKGTTEALERLQVAWARVAEQREQPLREEIDVLRWLISGFSRELEAPWQQFAATTIAVAAAKELNDLTRFGVGLPDARALLGQTLQLSEGSETSSVAVATRPEIVDLTPVVAAVAGGEPPALEPAVLAAWIYDELRLIAAYAEVSE